MKRSKPLNDFGFTLLLLGEIAIKIIILIGFEIRQFFRWGVFFVWSFLDPENSSQIKNKIFK